MAVTFRCNGCGKTYAAPDAHTGKRAKCPHCGAQVLVPEPPPVSSPPQALPVALSTGVPTHAVPWVPITVGVVAVAAVVLVGGIALSLTRPKDSVETGRPVTGAAAESSMTEESEQEEGRAREDRGEGGSRGTRRPPAGSGREILLRRVSTLRIPYSLQRKTEQYLQDLRSGDAGRRRKAINELGLLKENGAAPVLVEFLKRRVETISVVGGLGLIGSAPAIEPLVGHDLLQYSDRSPQSDSGAIALGRIGKPGTAHYLLKKTGEQPQDYYYYLGEGYWSGLGPKGLPEHISRALGLLREKTAVPALIYTLEKGDPQRADAAAWALGQVGGSQAIAALQRALEKRRSLAAVFSALGVLKVKPVLPTLVECLEPQIEAESRQLSRPLSPEEESAVIQTLACLGDQRAVPILRRYLEAHPFEKSGSGDEAATALVALEDRETIQSLLAKAGAAKGSESLRAWAILSLWI